MAFSTQDSDEVLSEINVTPLVDVMLVLLVVFIVTAPLLTNAIPISLPKTEAVAPVEQKDPLVVSIDGGRQVVHQQGRDPAGLAGDQLAGGQGQGPGGTRATAGGRRCELWGSGARHGLDRAGGDHQAFGDHRALNTMQR